MNAFIDLVASMRDAQKKHQDSHQLDDLKARGRWERAVDTTIADHLKLYDTPIDEEWLTRNGFKEFNDFWGKRIGDQTSIRLTRFEDCWSMQAYRLKSSTHIMTDITNAGEYQDALLAIGLSLPVY